IIDSILSTSNFREPAFKLRNSFFFITFEDLPSFLQAASSKQNDCNSVDFDLNIEIADIHTRTRFTSVDLGSSEN
ncbi:unnamed protein product, partial [Fusarium graminearum]